MTPDVHAEIGAARREALTCLVDQLVLIGEDRTAHLRRAASNPLQPSNAFEMPVLVSKDSIGERADNLPVNDCET